MSRNALMGLIDSLESTVRKLRWRPSGGGWASYDRTSRTLAEAFERKARLVGELLERTRPASVWDLAPDGYFSRMAAGSGARRWPSTSTRPASSRSYPEAREGGETRLLPLVLDLFNPSPASGWMNRERASIFDRGTPRLVMAWR